MELKISIPWGDGTNQYFYLDFSKIQENDIKYVNFHLDFTHSMVH